MNTALRTISLRVGYSRNILFDDLNLSLPAGKLVCFMGPNGVGKSSLIRTLAGIQKPQQGKVEILTGENRKTATDLAVVLTDKIQSTNVTARELITFGRYPYVDWRIQLSHHDKQVIEHALHYLRIEQLANRSISELSDGQLQMVMIARAIAQDTSILLLDEPTAHLDLNNRVEIMKLLRSLARESGKSILVSTHELDLALQTADYIWLTGKSKNILTGIPEDLVLDGSFDDVFQFKGFDLKSGKMHHDAWQKKVIHLTGEGHDFLWTKNALERSGFKVVSQSNKAHAGAEEILVKIEIEESKPRWILQDGNRQYKSTTIAGLMEHI